MPLFSRAQLLIRNRGSLGSFNGEAGLLTPVGYSLWLAWPITWHPNSKLETTLFSRGRLILRRQRRTDIT